MIASVTDILLLASFTLFVIGFFAVIIPPLRRGLKVIYEKFRLRHLFVGSLFCFALSLGFGWEDFKAGWNDESCETTSTTKTDVEP